MNALALLPAAVPRRILATGFAGTLLLAIGGSGAGALPKGKDPVANLLHLSWLRDNDVAQAICAGIVLSGVLLLALAWWRLREVLHTVPSSAILVVAGLWSLPLLLAPPLFSGDVYAYAGQGNIVANGLDPYTYGPGDLSPTGRWAYRVDAAWRFTPSPYGPVWLWLAGRVVVLSQDHLVPALFMLRLLAVVGLLLIAWALPKLASAHGVPPQRALWLGIANPFVLIHGVGGAHNDTLMVGLLVAGLAVAGRSPTARKLVLGAALITVGALIKLPAVAALAALPMLLPTWPQRFRAAALVGVTAAATAALLTFATGLGVGWLHTLDAGSARLSIFSPTTGVGVALGNLLQAVGLVEQPGTATRLVLITGLGIAGVLAIVLMLRSHHTGPLRALGLSLVVVVALAPVVQPWYLLWGLVLLAAVGGEKVTIALGALSVALCLALMPNGRSLIRPPLYGAPALAATALAAFEVRRSTRKVLEETEEQQQEEVLV